MNTTLVSAILWLALVLVLVPFLALIACAIHEMIQMALAEWRIRRHFRRALGRDPTPREVLHYLYGYPMPSGDAP